MEKMVNDNKDNLVNAKSSQPSIGARVGRRLEGVVISDKMQKTVVVNVTRLKKHPKYLKYYKVSRRFKAHNENNEYKIGDKVFIEETRPLSKDKRWRVVSKVDISKSPIAQHPIS